MALPLLILAGTTIASTAALAYDWLKTTTSAPIITVDGTATTSTVNWGNVARLAGVGLVGYYLFKRLK